jgi:anti-sigma regulatory factor (Ser/Thr protein kinase)
VDGEATKLDRPDIDTAELSITLTAGHQLGGVRRRIRRWLATDLPQRDGDEILLACGEALANALEHGRPPITVEMHWQRERGGKALHIAVCDAGQWRVTADTETRGLGIPIMTAVMNTVSIDTINGTEVRLVRQF